MDINLLDLIPEQKVKFEQLNNGKIILLKPKFKKKFLVKYLQPKLSKPNYKIKLDRFGSFVWTHCDGKNTVEQIGNLLKEKFQDDIEPVYDRLAVFIQSLARYRFIEYKNYDRSGH